LITVDKQGVPITQRLPSGSVFHTEHKLNIRASKFKWKPKKILYSDRIFVNSHAAVMGGEQEEVNRFDQRMWVRRRSHQRRRHSEL
jgi:hypothetical protein